MNNLAKITLPKSAPNSLGNVFVPNGNQVINYQYPKNLFGLFLTFRVISIFARLFSRPSKNTLQNKHKIDISRVIVTLQGYFCLAR